MAIEAFSVIREAMERSGKLALGRVVLHQRERLMALEPRDNGIVAYSLRTYDEVRPPQDYFASIPDRKPDEKMVDIAERIIDQLEGPFDPLRGGDRPNPQRPGCDLLLHGRQLLLTAILGSLPRALLHYLVLSCGVRRPLRRAGGTSRSR